MSAAWCERLREGTKRYLCVSVVIHTNILIMCAGEGLTPNFVGHVMHPCQVSGWPPVVVMVVGFVLSFYFLSFRFALLVIRFLMNFSIHTIIRTT